MQTNSSRSLVRYSLGLLVALFVISSVAAKPFLRVGFLAETDDKRVKPMPGFSGFYIPRAVEAEPMPPLRQKIDDYTVTVAGQPALKSPPRPSDTRGTFHL